MTNSGDGVTWLECISQILLRCFLLAVMLLLFWFSFFLIGGDWAFGIHSSLIEITKHEFDLLNYCGMALLKIVAIVFFLFPYVSTRIVLQKERASADRSS